MGTRRQARERAIQFLFQHDLNPPEDLDSVLEHFWMHQRPAVIELLEGKSTWGEPKELPPPTVEDLAIQQFAEPLVRGVIENRDAIDHELANLAANWDLHRMAVVDRNILRLAVFEMLHREDIPPVVTIWSPFLREPIFCSRALRLRLSGRKTMNQKMKKMKNMR